ncbi:MAG: hypothetical protein KF906_12095 [Actinobacteria bacterium]|nr:hypothetical protein [Actinomycetota bacterium]
MGLRDSWKQAREAMAAGMKGEGPSEEALASLSPEQRAAYDARIAEVAAARGGAQRQHERLVADHAASVAARPLQGPAGEWLYGPAVYPGANPATLDGPSPGNAVRGELGRLAGQVPSAGEITDAVLHRSENPAAPPPAPDDQRPVVAAAERAARDAARAPYVAPERVRHAITRLSARADSELDEVAAYLASSGLAGRADVVFGCYRVPDHIGRGTGTRGRYVEWDVVHAADVDLAPAPPPTAVTIDGSERWVARAGGEPSVLDEDLAIAYLAATGLGPDRVLGLARGMQVRSTGGDAEGNGASTMVEVTGVHVLHAGPGAGGPGPEAFAAWTGTRPVAVPVDGHPGVRVEVLNWAAIAEAVRPQHHRPVPVPSPFPYLPSSPQELLGAYLEVVGIHPAHCFGASVVEDRHRSIDGVSSGLGGLVTTVTDRGAESTCADGKVRRRLVGGVHVVVAYLDAPAYVEGRDRWEAYQRDVLRSNLAAETFVRGPVFDDTFGEVPAGLRGLVRGAKKVAKVAEVLEGGWSSGPHPHRYCWPPSAPGAAR